MKLKNVSVNELVLSLNGARIVRGADGVPTAIRVMAPGPMSLTINGQEISGEIAAQDISQILDYHRMKGELIPVDCEHLLQMLADLKGVEESELIRTEPILGEKAAAGFARLTEQNGELWAQFEKWSARAKELLTAAGDRIYGYFSPVLRGLKDGPLRITSIALTNVPAINGQDLLAARGEVRIQSAVMNSEHSSPEHSDTEHARRRSTMEWLKKLAGLVGHDEAALSAEADRDAVIAKAEALIASQAAKVQTFLKSVKDSLALTDTDTLDVVAGKILSALEKAKGDAAALKELSGRVEKLEADEKKRAIADLKTAGKLTEAMMPWAEKQDLVSLMDWAKTAPVIVQTDRIVKPGDAKTTDTLAMSDMDVEIARNCGIDPKKVAEVCGLKVGSK